MKNSHHAIGFLIATTIVLTACSKKENASILLPELTQAEAIMYEHPDSALKILQDMQVPPTTQKLQNATWALLMTQAKYKMFIKQTDSLVNIAYSYFMKREDASKQALVLYLKGGICYENKEEDNAQKYFLKAINIAEKIKNYQLCYLIYSKLGNIYAYNTIREYALTTFKKAYQYAQKSENSEYIISSLIFLGRAYTIQEDYEYAIESYTKAVEKAEKAYNRKKIMLASNELAGVYQKVKDHKRALQYLKQVQRISNNNSLQGQIFLTLGRIYSETGKTDSAYYYLNKLLSFETYIRTITDTYYTLYMLSKKEKKHKKATFYADKLIYGLDSIQRLDQSRDLAEMQEKYNQQKVINEKNQLTIENDENTRKALIMLVLLICAIATLIYIYQHKLMKKERTIQKKEEDLRRNTIKISENELLIKRNQLRMEELIAQIEANKDMQEQLDELNETYSEIQQQNEVLIRDNQALQANIEQYTSSLNVQSEELKKLNELTKESQRLHDREKILSNQLVKNSKILNNLITAPKYIDTIKWKDIEESINTIFDNFTVRLLKKTPTLTEYDLHLCCLIKLSMSNTNIATALGISPTSVSKQKFRLKERIAQQVDISWENSTLDLWIWDF